MEKIILSSETCPVTFTTHLIGGRWKPLIIFMISLGINRFGEMQRALPEISKTMLTQELRDLEKNSIIDREIFAEIPPRVEYSLTAWGKATLPILQAMAEWGQNYRLQNFAEIAEEQLL
ncbi:MAG: helix-turn-helix transcriptional regulator [Microscillaceae bacterium]|jgi:DNA-binding HxlR family transcriptional regulator|nr:helix-turn-helix transcriptional regulator [Microscillaceae bacterium]